MTAPIHTANPGVLTLTHGLEAEFDVDARDALELAGVLAEHWEQQVLIDWHDYEAGRVIRIARVWPNGEIEWVDETRYHWAVRQTKKTGRQR